MTYRVTVDERCGLTRFCTRIAPEVFTVEDGASRASVRPGSLDGLDEDSLDEVFEAEAACPLSAITVDADG